MVAEEVDDLAAVLKTLPNKLVNALDEGAVGWAVVHPIFHQSELVSIKVLFEHGDELSKIFGTR